jgi:flagellar basal body rod protein FlgG
MTTINITTLTLKPTGQTAITRDGAFLVTSTGIILWRKT